MDNDWFDRLKTAVEADPRGMRAISVAAGCGPNYLQQAFKDGKRPGTDRLVRILDALGSTSTLYVLGGLRLTPEDEEFLRLVTDLDPETRARAVEFFRSLVRREESAEPLASAKGSA